MATGTSEGPGRFQARNDGGRVSRVLELGERVKAESEGYRGGGGGDKTIVLKDVFVKSVRHGQV
jgi:hypothetical protein